MEKTARTVGLVDPDGITGSMPKDFKTIGSYHRSQGGESCNGKKVSTDLSLGDAAKAIQKKCEPSHYALLWDSGSAKVIFRDRIFSITKRPTAADLKEVKDYAKRKGCPVAFIDGIKDDIRMIGASSAKSWVLANCRFVRKASMDAYIGGYRQPMPLDTILDICRLLYSEGIDWKGFKDGEKAMRGMDQVSPDGDQDAFGPTGTINFYTQGLLPDTVSKALSKFRELAKAKGFAIGPYRQDPPTGAARVYRVPITKNDNDSSKQDIPPSINMANANAVFLMEKVLRCKRDPGGHGYSMRAADMLKRIDYFLGESTLPTNDGQLQIGTLEKPGDGDEWNTEKYVETPLGTMKMMDENDQANMHPDMKNLWDTLKGIAKPYSGYNEADVREKLERLKQFAEWAVSHGYSEIGVG